ARLAPRRWPRVPHLHRGLGAEGGPAARDAAAHQAPAPGRQVSRGADRGARGERRRPDEAAAGAMIVTERSEVLFGGTKIVYGVRRSSRRTTVSIVVDPHEGVVVRAPDKTPVERLDRVVHAKARWIVERLNGRFACGPAPASSCPGSRSSTSAATTACVSFAGAPKTTRSGSTAGGSGSPWGP